ncbi:MAG: ribokinase [Alphaproteobacteria bacterium]|nr:ribokinase [Alphaproteobacteria bacterium]
MASTILTSIGLPVLVRLLSEALGSVDTPVTKGASKALDAVDAAIRAGQVTPDQVAEANRHAEAMARMKLEENTANLSEINRSLRAEIVSDDTYIRRMRPTFGYLMALTWAAQMFGVAYVIIFDTERAGAVMSAMGSLSAIWAVGLSVLGIYVYKRSEDKKILPFSQSTLPSPPSPVKAKEVIVWND